MTAAVPTQTPTGPLREVPWLLRGQWAEYLDSSATVLHWLLAPDEWKWVETFLEGPMDGASKAILVDEPAEHLDGYGDRVGRALIRALTKVPLGNYDRWTCPRLPGGLCDVDVLALLLLSFARHTHGTWLRQLAVVLAPEHIPDEWLWLRWVEAFTFTLARHGTAVRIILLDDVRRPRYAALGHARQSMVHTTRAHLELGDRILRMVEAAADPERLEGRLRPLLVRTLQCVNEGRVDAAERHARAFEALVAEGGRHGASVPVRFAVAGGLLAQGRPVDAVRAYRAAESAAERAEVAGDACGLRLRIASRFGVAAGLLSTPHGAVSAARYYEETAPLCRRLDDRRLEFEAHRCSAVAYELAAEHRSAWNSAMNALAIVDHLMPEERALTMLVSLVDAVLRLTESWELRHHRTSIEGELRKRALNGSKWT